MHDSAAKIGCLFFDTYAEYYTRNQNYKPLVLEIGVNSDKTLENKAVSVGFDYRSIDQIHTDNPDDVYTLPFETGTVDVVISSSCFEHDCFFWITFLEIMRVLKPNGTFYLNAPSRGGYHCHPIDCFRFFPDAGLALTKWGRKNNMKVQLLESFTDTSESWNDYVAVFLRDEEFRLGFKTKMLDQIKDA